MKCIEFSEIPNNPDMKAQELMAIFAFFWNLLARLTTHAKSKTQPKR